jgi:glycosyltransferase involved in cell wall biosynthesis
MVLEAPAVARAPDVALLTGGGDRPYAHGLALSLVARGLAIDFIGSDELESEELRTHPQIRFLNLRGDARQDCAVVKKIARVLRYYGRLLRYSVTAQPRVFHILWNNRLEHVDRTLLLLFYRLLGKKVLFTVHNVNAASRDGVDSMLNRATLRFQYRHVHHLFAHTRLMKRQLCEQYAVVDERISIIPFGINNTVPVTSLGAQEARKRLGVGATEKCVLFFGNIAPYKGLEILVQAVGRLRAEGVHLRLIIAGRTKGSEVYWQSVRSRIDSLGLRDHVLERIEFIPDGDIEVYFKAADVLALPYTHVFQSGVLFLGYNFGLPIIASDIASFREDIIEGETGFLHAPNDPAALAATLKRYFESDLFQSLAARREQIRILATERYSWGSVAETTEAVYRQVIAT